MGVGAVLIQGPKWCGKTTTAEQQAKSVVYMDDPEYTEQDCYKEFGDSVFLRPFYWSRSFGCRSQRSHKRP